MFRSEEAQGLVEYALIVALVVVVALVGLRFLAGRTNNTLTNDANLMPY